MVCCYFVGMYGKSRPIATPWYQISTLLAFILQVHRGLHQPPWLKVLQKTAWLDEGYFFWGLMSKTFFPFLIKQIIFWHFL